jgi:hypothetical protein
MITKEQVEAAIHKLGIVRAGTLDDGMRWSSSELAEDLAAALLEVQIASYKKQPQLVFRYDTESGGFGVAELGSIPHSVIVNMLEIQKTKYVLQQLSQAAPATNGAGQPSRILTPGITPPRNLRQNHT